MFKLFVDLLNVGCNVILAGKCILAGKYIPLHQCQPFQYLSTMWFLPARRYASAGLCDSDVSVRLSVRPPHAGIVPSRAKEGS